jgi:hypothetical protein
MNMKTMKRLSLVTLLLLLAASVGFAQTATTQTTLSAAITSASATTISVASATGFTAGTTFAYTGGELMAVTAVNGTTISVIRGSGGTIAKMHVTASVVWVGPFSIFRGTDPVGACTAANEVYLPQINTATGGVFYCTNGKWQGVYWQQTMFGRFPRTPVANVAYTAKLTDVLIVMTSISGGKTITLPSATGLDGKFYIISDESGGASASSTLTIAGTINGASNQTITTAYGVVRVRSNGTAWFLW